MKKLNIPLFSAFLCVMLSNNLIGQISGPQCILPNAEYQYNLFTFAERTDSISLCIRGGKIVPGNDSCYIGPFISSIRVIWNENIADGSIVLNHIDTFTFTVQLTTELIAGNIDAASALQEIDSVKIPTTIVCSQPSGGSCSPFYQYQWESSYDDLHWEAMQGFVSANLAFANNVTRTTFFRRKVFDTSSKSLEYSDIAIVIIKD